MTENTNSTAPKWFKIIAIVALIWNLLGAMAYIMQVTMNPEDIAETEAQRVYYETYPSWATAAYAIAVWAGLVGSLGLVMRKSWAYYAYLLSLIGIVFQDVHAFLFADAISIFGASSLWLPILVILFSIYLLYLSKTAKVKGWIN